MTDALNWRALPDFALTLPEDDDNDRNPRKRLYVHPKPDGVGQAVSIVEATSQVWEAIRVYLADPDPDHVLLINGPPGSRKTSIAVELAELQALAGQTVLYAGPRHAHFEDTDLLARYPDQWVRWFPKQFADDAKNRQETCKEADRHNGWVRKGWNAHDYCVGVCGWKYKDHACVWHGQGRLVKKMKGAVIYGQHQHIFTGLPVDQVDLLVVDECPKGAVERTWKIPWQKIVPHHLAEDLPFRQLLLKLRRMVEENKAVSVNGPTLIAALGGWEWVFDASDGVLPLPNAIKPDLRREVDDEAMDWGHIWELQALLRAEARQIGLGKDYPSRVALHDGKLILTLRKDVSDKMPHHVICLDATGNAALYQSIFSGRSVKVVEPMISLQGKITQVWNNTWSISSLYDFDGKERTENQDHWEKAKLIVDEIAARFETVGFISYKGVVDALAPANATVKGWFGAERGTNRFVGVDALIVLGTPNPPSMDIEAMAKSLYRYRMTSFRGKDGKLPWSKKRVGYQYVHEDGLGRAIDVWGYWADPDLQAILEQEREAELYQALHRMRPLIQDRPVFLISNIPTRAEVEVVSIAELFDSPIGTDPYVWGRVKKFARERGAVILPITTSDLTENLGIERHTAAKMMEVLLRRGHWRLPTEQERIDLPKKGRGQPQSIILPC